MLSGTSGCTHRRVPLDIRLCQPLEERRLLGGRQPSTAVRPFLLAGMRYMSHLITLNAIMDHAVQASDATQTSICGGSLKSCAVTIAGCSMQLVLGS